MATVILNRMKTSIDEMQRPNGPFLQRTNLYDETNCRQVFSPAETNTNELYQLQKSLRLHPQRISRIPDKIRAIMNSFHTGSSCPSG